MPGQRMKPWMRRCAVVAALALLAGCSSVRPWINEPLKPEDQAIPERKSERDPTILVAVTLSGGGARAAAFGFGVLTVNTAEQAFERCKPGKEPKVGDVYVIRTGFEERSVVVQTLSAVRRGAPEAQTLYEETADSVLRRQRRAELRRFGAEPAQDIRGRPTKRDGRRLRDLPSD